jgi:hypothetical protein
MGASPQAPAGRGGNGSTVMALRQGMLHAPGPCALPTCHSLHARAVQLQLHLQLRLQLLHLQRLLRVHGYSVQRRHALAALGHLHDTGAQQRVGWQRPHPGAVQAHVGCLHGPEAMQAHVRRQVLFRHAHGQPLRASLQQRGAPFLLLRAARRTGREGGAGQLSHGVFAWWGLARGAAFVARQPSRRAWWQYARHTVTGGALVHTGIAAKDVHTALAQPCCAAC